MSKSFFQLKEDQILLEEIASQIGPGCNYLQRMYWEQWAEANYDYGNMCPIMYQPYEQIVPGGIAVIGYNPGWPSSMDKAMEKSFQTKGNWKKEMHEVHKASGGKYIFAPYKKSQQSFDNKGLTSPPGVEGGGFTATQKDEKGNYDQEAPRVRTGPDFSLSNYTIAWQSEKTQPEFLRNTTGGYMYHAQLVKMVTDGGMGAYVRDICGTNLIPFPSQDIKKIKGIPLGKLEKICYEHYLKNFFKVMKPRVVICPTNIYDILEKVAGVKTKDTRWQQKWIDNNDHKKGTELALHHKSGKPQKYLRWGVTSQGTKVLGILHWSGSQSGGTNKLNWQLMTKPDPDSGKTDAQKLFSLLLAKGN